MRAVLIFCAGVLLGSVAVAAATADRNKLPVQFTGDWCIQDDDHVRGQTYRFGSYLPTHKANAGWFTVGANGFAAHEVSCKPVRSVADETSRYLVQFHCDGGGKLDRKLLDVPSTIHDSHRS
jgi:hypothetical protein